YHVFIKHGLMYLCEQDNKQISILEMGFGTALNAFITFLEARKLNTNVDYCGIEGYPISAEEALKLNYVTELKAEGSASIFEKMHNITWEKTQIIAPHFLLTKYHMFFADIEEHDKFNLIYFDAFAARVQPELWTET